MLLARTPTATRLRWQVMSVGAGLLLVIIVALVFSRSVARLDFYLQDLLLTSMARQKLPENFVFVDIDERALSASGLEPEELAGSPPLQLIQAGWPWSREVYAALAERLFDAGARMVIFDILLPSSRPGDETFVETLRKHPGKIVLASSYEVPADFQKSGKIPSLVPPNQDFQEAIGGNFGLVNFPPSTVDGKIRRLFTRASSSNLMNKETLDGEDVYPTITTVAANLLGVVPPEGRPRRFRYSLQHSLPIVSLHEIFVPRVWESNLRNGALFKDKIVLVGASAERLHDSYPTPWGVLAGPEVQLHALAAVLRGQWLNDLGSGAVWISILLAAAATFGILMVRRNIVWFVMALVGGVLLWLLVCAASLEFLSLFLPMAQPLLTWLACGFAGLACDVMLERRERGRLRGTLERYVSRDLVHEIVENPNSFLHSLEGQRKEIVALFSDLQGFTADTERLDPVEMVKLLNEYFSEMVKTIFGHHGTNDKFIGDAIMATWGCLGSSTPKDDAVRAVAAGIEMKQRLMKLNAVRKERGSVQWRSGIGISQGLAIFGNMGSDEKMDLTVIGDTVNLASRIEGLTRIYQCGILVSARVAENARESFEFLFVDEVRVKGRKQTEKLFVPYASGDAAWAQAFTAARALYLSGDFLAARDAFGKLSSDGFAPALASCFVTRCEDFIRSGPGAGWDGVWDFLEK